MPCLIGKPSVMIHNTVNTNFNNFYDVGHYSEHAVAIDIFRRYTINQANDVITCFRQRKCIGLSKTNSTIIEV